MSFVSKFVPKLIRGNRGEVTDTARQSDFARQMREQQSVEAINRSFADPGRETQRRSFVDALRTQMADATGRAYEDQARKNLFRTARGGLTGGSVDIDRQRRGLEGLQTQRLSDEAKAQSTYADLLAGDEAQRAALVSQVYGQSNPGAGSIQNLLRGRAGIANYRAGMHPQFLQDTGKVWADMFGQSGETDAYNRGYGYAAGGGR